MLVYVGLPIKALYPNKPPEPLKLLTAKGKCSLFLERRPSNSRLKSKYLSCVEFRLYRVSKCAHQIALRCLGFRVGLRVTSTRKTSDAPKRAAIWTLNWLWGQHMRHPSGSCKFTATPSEAVASLLQVIELQGQCFRRGQHSADDAREGEAQDQTLKARKLQLQQLLYAS